VIDREASEDGRLTMKRVSAAIRMLGAGFFQEVTSGKKLNRLKTYDAAMIISDSPEQEDLSNTLHAETGDEMCEDDLVEALFQEGDEDAILIADFENAAADVIQQDEDLASAFNAYTEARKRLSDKVKSRGFWPLSKGKYKGSQKGVKGKFQKGHQSNRKSLQQRILTSACRLCGKIGHWRAECPNRADASGASRPQAPTSFVQVQGGPESLRLEFLQLPSMESTVDEPHTHESMCFTCSHGKPFHETSEDRLKRSLSSWKQSCMRTNRLRAIRNEPRSHRMHVQEPRDRSPGETESADQPCLRRTAAWE